MNLNLLVTLKRKALRVKHIHDFDKETYKKMHVAIY
jgi:hypothetical protein